VGIGWLATIVTGTYLLLAYANAPGQAGSPPENLPQSSQVPRDTERPTLVMFIHPHCPCSRASVGELAEVMAHCQGAGQCKRAFSSGQRRWPRIGS